MSSILPPKFDPNRWWLMPAEPVFRYRDIHDELTSDEIEIAIAEREEARRALLRDRFVYSAGVVCAAGFLIASYLVIKQRHSWDVIAAEVCIPFGVLALAFWSAAMGVNSSRRDDIGRQLAVLNVRRQLLGRQSGNGADQVAPYFDRLVEINVTNLAEYYSLVKDHTGRSFTIASWAGVLGFLLVAAGVGIGFYKDGHWTPSTSVAAGAGVLTEFISAVFFYLYNRTVTQLKDYHDSLLSVQNILLSFKMVGDTPEQDARQAMLRELLTHLTRGERKVAGDAGETESIGPKRPGAAPRPGTRRTPR